MRSTINIDDHLIEKARSLTGVQETNAIVRKALETLVRSCTSGENLFVVLLMFPYPAQQLEPSEKPEQFIDQLVTVVNSGRRIVF